MMIGRIEIPVVAEEVVAEEAVVPDHRIHPMAHTTKGSPSCYDLDSGSKFTS